MTFKEYIANRRISDNPQGDFTRGARETNMPDIKTWNELRSYVKWSSGQSEVIAAARLVWQGYVIKNRQV